MECVFLKNKEKKIKEKRAVKIKYFFNLFYSEIIYLVLEAPVKSWTLRL